MQKLEYPTSSALVKVMGITVSGITLLQGGVMHYCNRTQHANTVTLYTLATFKARRSLGSISDSTSK